MKKVNLFFIILLGSFFLTCHNPIMERWWNEDCNNTVNPVDPGSTGGSGENFAIVVFVTDGGIPQPRSIKIAWGGTVGRLRPISRGDDGFLGWFERNGMPWDVETRPVTKDDVDNDGFITLTARWVRSTTAAIYTIKFEPYPTSIVPSPPFNAVTIDDQRIASGGKVVQPLKPPALPDSRGFAGWYTEDTFIHQWNFNLPVSADVTLYAKWENNTRTVKFESNGGTRPDGSTLLTHEFTVALSYGLVQHPGPLVKEGFSFAGWYMNPGFSGEPWNFNTKKVTDSDVPVVGGITTLYAKWEQNIYFVNFVISPSTATAPSRQSIPHGEKAAKPADLPQLGDGRNFTGWYTEPEFFNQWNFDNPVTSTMTLHARFSPQTRTVHFELNGGTGISRVNFSIPIASGVVINPGTPSRVGFTFGGWFIDPACTISWNFATDRITAPDEIIAIDPMYFYARWIPNTYRVTFDWKEAAIPRIQTQNIVYGERVEKPSIPANPGRAFVGWFIDPGFTTEWNFDTPLTSDRTLHARWQAAQYTVIFELRTPPGGTSGFTKPADQRIIHGGKVIEPFMPALPPPAQGVNETRYSFLRWDSSNDGGTTFQLFNFDTPVTSDMTLYARWVEPIPDMVWVPRGSFNMGDSSVSGSPAFYHAYPTRRVTIDGFFISRYQITQIDGSPLTQTGTGYQQVMGNNPSQFTGTTTRPVENVSWFDAIAYCNARSLREGLTPVYSGLPGTVTWSNNGYRLPTEAEWEYAAREAGRSPPENIYSGSSNAESVAWYNVTVGQEPLGFRTTQTVGRKMPNSLGIYDMSGNVSEWVWDWFAPYSSLLHPGPTGIGPNPRGPDSGTERVRRGGGWSNAAGNVRSVVRNSDTPDTANWVVGFRVVRGPRVIY
jgi:uncharacterized repeat protein (TIGR02543 family)